MGNNERYAVGGVYTNPGNASFMKGVLPGLSRTLKAEQADAGCLERSSMGWSIRRITPREAWRLMGFSDADFNAAQGVVSNSQLYKQAGNSIVENCLVAIFGQLFEGKEDAYRETVPIRKEADNGRTD